MRSTKKQQADRLAKAEEAWRDHLRRWWRDLAAMSPARRRRWSLRWVLGTLATERRVLEAPPPDQATGATLREAVDHVCNVLRRLRRSVVDRAGTTRYDARAAARRLKILRSIEWAVPYPVVLDLFRAIGFGAPAIAARDVAVFDQAIRATRFRHLGEIPGPHKGRPREALYAVALVVLVEGGWTLPEILELCDEHVDLERLFGDDRRNCEIKRRGVLGRMRLVVHRARKQRLRHLKI